MKPSGQSYIERRRDGRIKLGAAWQKEVVEAICQQPGISIPELAHDLVLPHNRLYRVLPEMEARGVVEKHRRGWYRKGDAPR